MEPFKVYTRIRPLNERELAYGLSKKAVRAVNATTISVAETDTRQAYFQVDALFQERDSNELIFQAAVRPLADNFLQGINSTVFAYGITGAGKSYTMFGRGGDYAQTGII